MKRIISILLLSTLLLITGCHHKKSDPNTLIVGTIAGPETALMEVAKEVALKEYGLPIKIVTFTDYTMPNQALEDETIDANAFQHQPFLDEQSKIHGYSFASVGNTFIYPMGLYSDKLKALSELQSDSKIAIPNDPSNQARALLLLQKAGLITLQPKVSINATLNDIAENPKKLTIVAVDAAQLSRLLPDVSLAAINANYAVSAGLTLSKALYAENIHSPYMNIIVVRSKDRDSKKVKNLVSAYQSEAVIAEAQKLFGDGAVPGFRVVDNVQ